MFFTRRKLERYFEQSRILEEARKDHKRYPRLSAALEELDKHPATYTYRSPERNDRLHGSGGEEYTISNISIARKLAEWRVNKETRKITGEHTIGEALIGGFVVAPLIVLTIVALVIMINEPFKRKREQEVLRTTNYERIQKEMQNVSEVKLADGSTIRVFGPYDNSSYYNTWDGKRLGEPQDIRIRIEKTNSDGTVNFVKEMKANVFRVVGEFVLIDNVTIFSLKDGSIVRPDVNTLNDISDLETLLMFRYMIFDKDPSIGVAFVDRLIKIAQDSKGDVDGRATKILREALDTTATTEQVIRRILEKLSIDLSEVMLSSNNTVVREIALNRSINQCKAEGNCSSLERIASNSENTGDVKTARENLNEDALARVYENTRKRLEPKLDPVLKYKGMAHMKEYFIRHPEELKSRGIDLDWEYGVLSTTNQLHRYQNQ